MGEILDAHVRPEQALLIQAQNRDRNAMIGAIKQGIIEGIRETQLPRPDRAAKAGVTANTHRTHQLPDETFDSGQPRTISIGLTSGILFQPPQGEPKRLLAFTLSIGQAGSRTISLGFNAANLTATPVLGEETNGFFAAIMSPTVNPFYQPLGKGQLITNERPLLAIASQVVIVLFIPWFSDLRE